MEITCGSFRRNKKSFSILKKAFVWYVTLLEASVVSAWSDSEHGGIYSSDEVSCLFSIYCTIKTHYYLLGPTIPHFSD